MDKKNIIINLIKNKEKIHNYIKDNKTIKGIDKLGINFSKPIFIKHK